MDKRDVDKFESTKQNIFAEEIGQKDNFFLNNNSKSFKNNLLSSIPTRRLNDYDYKKMLIKILMMNYLNLNIKFQK